MKKAIISIVVLAIVGIGIYFLVQSLSGKDVVENQNTADSTQSTDNQATPNEQAQENKDKSVIGTSVEGRDITAYHFGSGATKLLFVGGIHGGYEWNTVLAAYELVDYLKENPAVIPDNVEVTVIPVLNPDGLYKVVGTTSPFAKADVSSSQSTVISGRFNSNEVDLNRNFDCDWQATGTWQNKTVSGGSKAFSEPESQAFKNYVETYKPTAAIVWYSAAGGVYASSCHNGVSSETRAIMKKYADASKYPAYDDFDFYAITGDMTNWLAKSNVPAISILLTNHTDIEWAKNQAGIDAILNYYTK